jgi:hypothetical protein
MLTARNFQKGLLLLVVVLLVTMRNTAQAYNVVAGRRAFVQKAAAFTAGAAMVVTAPVVPSANAEEEELTKDEKEAQKQAEKERKQAEKEAKRMAEETKKRLAVGRIGTI